MAEAGIKELTLVAQDLTAYGYDLGPGAPRLIDLLRAILAETEIPWIRLLYLYPVRVDATLLTFIADNPRVLPYLDIPLQHISSKVLEAMNRPYSSEQVVGLMQMINDHLPQAAVRTTFMVGFPGETEEDVDQIAAFMEQYRLANVGIFEYSNEEGCAAYSMTDQCSDEVKGARRARLMELQSSISLSLNKQMVGRIEQVLVEGISKETDLLLEGRTGFQAPEIDGCVYINSGECASGEFVQVLITEAHPYDLVGEVVADKDKQTTHSSR